MARSFVRLQALVTTSDRKSKTLTFRWPNEDFQRSIPLRGKTFRPITEDTEVICEMQRLSAEEFNLLNLVDAEAVEPAD